MENNLESKQEYLSSEILEKGYNTDKFLAVLKSIKGDSGDNLDKWSPEELESVVKKFQNENSGEPSKPAETQIETQPSTKPEDEKKNPFATQVTNTLSSQDVSPSANRTGRLTTNFMNIDEEITCQLPEQTELTGVDDLEIKLSLYEYYFFNSF